MDDDLDISRRQRKARADLLASVQKALANDETRVLLRWVLDQTGMFEPAFTGNSKTFFNEGRREVGLEIVAMLNEIDPYEYVRLMKEGADDVVRKRNQDRKDKRNVS